MSKRLSKRLSACLEALSSLSRIADIGTDHAYLPCYGVSSGMIDSAIAIDVIEGPLMQAKRTIADYGLADKIELRKGSGFEPLAIGEVEGVNMAGMGGKLISQLITDSLPVARSMKLLVLQPQGGEFDLRAKLFKNDFALINEQLIEEDGIIYTIMTAKPNNLMLATYEDLQFGPILKQNTRDDLFIKKWQQEIIAIEKVLHQIPKGHERRRRFELKKKLIQEVLASAYH